MLIALYQAFKHSITDRYWMLTCGMAGAGALVPLMPLALAGWPASQNPVAEAGSFPDNFCHVDMSQLLVRTCLWQRQHHVQPQRLAPSFIILALTWQALTGCVFCRAATFRNSTALTIQQMIRLMYSSRWRYSGKCRVCDVSDNVHLAATLTQPCSTAPQGACKTTPSTSLIVYLTCKARFRK